MTEKCLKLLPAKLRREISELSFPEQIDAINDILKNEINSKRQMELQRIIHTRAERMVKSHPKGEKAGLNAFLAMDRNEMSSSVSLDGRLHSLKSHAENKVFDMMEEFKPTGIYTRDSVSLKQQDAFLDILIDGDTKGIIDPKLKTRYKDMAKNWLETKEYLRQRFNRAGGDIKKLADWNLPTSHDPSLVGKVSLDEWQADMLEAIDLQKMGVDEAEFRRASAEAYHNIKSDGVIEFELAYKGEGKLANRHRQSRFFKFKDAAGYKKYHAKYSTSTPYETMMDYVGAMSSEISLMESLGPNPDMTIRSLTRNDSQFANKIYANLAGKTAARNLKVADSMDMIRNVVTGLKLGGAQLSALPDVILHSITNQYNNLPAFKSLQRTISDLTNLSGVSQAQRRKLASQLWVPMDHMIESAHSAARYSDVAGHKGSKKFASLILKASGLDAWTVIQKRAFHIEFMGGLANNIDDMAPTLKKYGIMPDDIAKIKASKKIEDRGATFVDPAELPEELAERIVGMVISETKSAVVEGDAFVKAMMNQGERKGDAGGEIIRFFAQFKSFPVSVMANHWLRMMKGRGSISRGNYFAQFAIATTLMGAAVIQLKEISKGNTPRDWNDYDFWKDAALQGGATSLLGDIVLGDSRSFGGSLQDFVSGPALATANDILFEGVLGSLDDARKGDKKLRDYVAGATDKTLDQVPNLWYSKAVMDRYILDEMRRLSDPNFDRKERKKERKRYKELGNKRWLQ